MTFLERWIKDEVIFVAKIRREHNNNRPNKILKEPLRSLSFSSLSIFIGCISLELQILEQIEEREINNE